MEGQSGLKLDGYAWKDKDSTTYTSILDLYGVSDLFSNENNTLYQDKQVEEKRLQEDLQKYVFSGLSEQEQNDDELINYIFSEEINVAKVKSYVMENKESTIYFIGVAIIVVTAFVAILNIYNRERKRRRKEFATEINLENIATK